MRYEEDGEGHSIAPDHTYDYGHALADGVLPVVFGYSGEARWRTSAIEEFAARLEDLSTTEPAARAWKTLITR